MFPLSDIQMIPLQKLFCFFYTLFVTTQSKTILSLSKILHVCFISISILRATQLAIFNTLIGASDVVGGGGGGGEDNRDFILIPGET